MNTFKIWDKKVLRKVFAGRLEDRLWKIKTKDMCDLLNKPNSIGVIKSHRLRWMGHTKGIQENIIPMMVMLQSIERKNV